MKSFSRNVIGTLFALAVLYFIARIIIAIAKNIVILEFIAKIILVCIIACSIILFIGWFYENIKKRK